MGKRGKQVIAAVSLLLFFIHGYGQCKTFIKKQCLPNLAPYTSDGQLNNAQLAAGEMAELEFTFYSGQEYRIYVCAQEVLGTIQFKLMDSSHKELFNSKDSKNLYWDFHIETTQQLILEVSAPESKDAIVPNGCVGVLIGFKDSKR